MEVSRAVLSMLGCSEYHKRFLRRGSVEQYLYCGSVEKVPTLWK